MVRRNSTVSALGKQVKSLQQDICNLSFDAKSSFFALLVPDEHVKYVLMCRLSHYAISPTPTLKDNLKPDFVTPMRMQTGTVRCIVQSLFSALQICRVPKEMQHMRVRSLSTTSTSSLLLLLGLWSSFDTLAGILAGWLLTGLLQLPHGVIDT